MVKRYREEPVVFDVNATEVTKQQMKSFVASKGYFDGKVTDTVKDRKKGNQKLFTMLIFRQLIRFAT